MLFVKVFEDVSGFSPRSSATEVLSNVIRFPRFDPSDVVSIFMATPTTNGIVADLQLVSAPCVNSRSDAMF